MTETAMMKAAVVRSAGEPPEYADFAEPAAGPGYEPVELVAAGIHQLVRSRAQQRHYTSEGAYPLVPGVDAVARCADGALIYTGNVAAPFGTMAERMAVPEAFHFELPAGTEHRATQVAGGMNPGMSSWLPLTARLGETEKLGTVVILGATGASGLLAVQNARDLGAARILALGRNEAALERAAGHGAEPVRLTDDREQTVKAIREALGGEAPGLVLDYVWGAPAETMFAALNRPERVQDGGDTAYVQIGALAGPEAALPSALLRSRRIRVQGSGMGSVPLARMLELMPQYVARIAEGKVEVPVETYPLSEVTRAWTAKAEGGGRIVVTA
jgi:NADPH:quinone reductase-like Zn-dependent oxidoreductase